MERVELGRLLGGHADHTFAEGSSEATQCGVGAPRAQDTPPSHIIAESDPVNFSAAFADAVAGTDEIFLCDPKWGASEKTQVRALLLSKIENSKSKINQGWLMIPTGGTSGTVRFARHDSQTIHAAVVGFTKHFGLKQVNAVGVLPLHHVSGLMAWLRCVMTGGIYVHADWKKIEAGVWPTLPMTPEGWVLSLVPTQLERLLRDAQAVEWLKSFRIIFLGGGPPWLALLERAAAASLPLALGYGMTETAAMVTALKPEEFLAGGRNSGAALPHASVSINEEGAILLEGDSLFRGYYPGWRESDEYPTQDLGALDGNRHLTVLGRSDGIIITGGEKVNPSEVEAVLRGTGEFSEVAVVGLPHAEWGSQIMAAYPATCSPDMNKVSVALTQQLARYKHPQRFVALPSWPQHQHGKLNRAEVVRMVTSLKPVK